MFPRMKLDEKGYESEENKEYLNKCITYIWNEVHLPSEAEIVFINQVLQSENQGKKIKYDELVIDILLKYQHRICNIFINKNTNEVEIEDTTTFDYKRSEIFWEESDKDTKIYFIITMLQHFSGEEFERIQELVGAYKRGEEPYMKIEPFKVVIALAHLFKLNKID